MYRSTTVAERRAERRACERTERRAAQLAATLRAREATDLAPSDAEELEVALASPRPHRAARAWLLAHAADALRSVPRAYQEIFVEAFVREQARGRWSHAAGAS